MLSLLLARESPTVPAISALAEVQKKSPEFDEHGPLSLGCQCLLFYSVFKILKLCS
jgi:hypothetical protein